MTLHLDWEVIVIVVLLTHLIMTILSSYITITSQKKTVYAIFASTFASAFVYGIEQHLFGINLSRDWFYQFLINYCVATSFYELIYKNLITFIKKMSYGVSKTEGPDVPGNQEEVQ